MIDEVDATIYSLFPGRKYGIIFIHLILYSVRYDLFYYNLIFKGAVMDPISKGEDRCKIVPSDRWWYSYEVFLIPTGSKIRKLCGRGDT